MLLSRILKRDVSAGLGGAFALSGSALITGGLLLMQLSPIPSAPTDQTVADHIVAEYAPLDQSAFSGLEFTSFDPRPSVPNDPMTPSLSTGGAMADLVHGYRTWSDDQIVAHYAEQWETAQDLKVDNGDRALSASAQAQLLAPLEPLWQLMSDRDLIAPSQAPAPTQIARFLALDTEVFLRSLER